MRGLAQAGVLAQVVLMPIHRVVRLPTAGLNLKDELDKLSEEKSSLACLFRELTTSQLTLKGPNL